jgi:predicted amidohydrolase YtcJ
MTVLTVPRLGDERSDRQYPLATLRDTGATLSFGSDWPCSSPRPFEGIRVATTRQTIEDLPVGGWTPAEKLTLTQALSAYTAGVAAQAFADLAERPWGTLRVGHSADLAFLDRDPRAAASAVALTEIAVVRTWLAGRETFATP